MFAYLLPVFSKMTLTTEKLQTHNEMKPQKWGFDL